jgi:hypothetical protein
MKFPTHKCELSLTHNEHKSYYESAAKFIAERKALWKDDESKKRAIDTDEIWQLQWYPRTPVGFHRVMAPTLQELLEFAATFDEGEES